MILGKYKTKQGKQEGEMMVIADKVEQISPKKCIM